MRQTLAQQAIHMMDRAGESAMHHFLYHARFRSSPSQLWTEVPTEVLRDQSTVALPNSPASSYRFTWLDSDQVAHTDSRPRCLDSVPPAPPHPLSLISWPSTDDVQGRVLELARQEAAKRTGLEYDEIFDVTPGDLAMVDLIAPGIRYAINDEINATGGVPEVTDIMQSLLTEYAQQSIARIPADEWEHLIGRSIHADA